MQLKNIFKIVLLGLQLNTVAWAQSSAHLDPTFGNNGRVITSIQPEGSATHPVSCLQKNGKIIVGTSIGKSLIIARYLDDGSIDNSWGTNGMVTTVMPGSLSVAKMTDMVALDNGSVLVTGYRDTLNSNGVMVRPYIAKYDIDGTLEPGFAVNGIQTVFSDSLMLVFGLSVHDDHILAFGQIEFSGDSIAIHALNVGDGSYDYSWGNNGTMIHEDETTNRFRVKALGENKVIMSRRKGISLFLSDGNYDSQFAQGGHFALNDINGGIANYHDPEENGQAYGVPIALQSSNSKILIAGIADSYSPYFPNKGIVKRLDTLGNVDNSFGNNGVVQVDFGHGFVNNITDMQVMENDNIIVVGNAVDTANGDAQYFALSKFNADGTVDSSFGNDGIVITSGFHQNENIDYVRRSLMQPNDDKIILTGFTPLFNNTVNGLPLNTFSLARYQTSTTSGGGSNIDEETSSNGLRIYPNPARNYINVAFESNESDEQVQMEVYNLNGQMIHREPTNSNMLNSMDISDLSSGVYILKVQMGETVSRQKFVKQ